MSIPSAVQARADAARQALSPPPVAPVAPAGDPEPAENTNATDTTPPAPRPGFTAGGNPVDMPDDVPAQQSKAPTGEAPPSGYTDPNDFEARYKALRASRNLDKERADAAEARARQLEAQVASLKGDAPKGDSHERTNERFKLSDDDRGYLGNQEAEVIEKVAQHADQRLDEIEQRNRDEDTRRHGAFIADLDSLMPGWRAQNDDRGFQAWLAQADEFGMTRQQILDHKVAERDAEGAVKLFKAYSAQGQTRVPDAPPTNAGPPVDPSNVSRATAEPDMVLVFSPEEVAAFFNEKTAAIRSKRYVGAVKADLDAREVEIRAAMDDKRVW